MNGDPMAIDASTVGSLSGLDRQDLDDIIEGSALAAADLRNARLLVTGATGWFGTWILDALVALNRRDDLGLQIVAISRAPEAFARRCPALHRAEEIMWRRGDINDERIAWDGRLTHVIHAAADSHAAVVDRRTTAGTIVNGARNVLGLAARHPRAKVLIVSSGAVYGPQPAGVDRLAETHRAAAGPPAVANPYAEGKREAERLVLDACRRDGLHATIARCFAFVGPHMPFDAHFAIGNFIADAAARRTVHVGGDGTPQRSYLYMSDCVTWLLAVLTRGAVGRAYNVGSPDAIAISALARRCAAPAGLPVLVAGQGGGADYVPDTRRAFDALGLRVRVPLDEAISRTLRWRQRTMNDSGDGPR